VFHPGNFCTYAGDGEARFLNRAQAHGAALLTDYEWLDFWQMRRSWRLTAVEHGHRQTVVRLAGTIPAAGLSVSLPTAFGGHAVRHIDSPAGRCDIARVAHFGEDRVLVPVADGATDQEFVVTYAEREA
jgi:hypothetical protein